MRIKRVVLDNFQAFPARFELDLEKTGKNLILYGENGSGKTSLYRALREALQPVHAPQDFGAFRNIFMPPGVPVELQVEMTPGQVYRWTSGQAGPSALQLIDAGRRAGFLDYRSLLRLSMRPVRSTLGEIFFDTAVTELLSRFEFPVGGRSETLLDLWNRVLSEQPLRPRRQIKRNGCI